MTKKHSFVRFLLLLLALCVFMGSRADATALIAGKSEEAATTEQQAAPEPIDSLGRSTPRGLVAGFLDAVGKEDFEKAAQYLDLSGTAEPSRKKKGPDMARDLQTLLDKGGWFYPTPMLSNDRAGRKDEGEIAEDTDLIGNLRHKGKTVDIVARKTVDENGAAIWLVSAQTLEQISDLSRRGTIDGEPPVNKVLPDLLIETKWFGAPAGHWLAVVVLLALSYASVWFFILGFSALMKKIWTAKCSISGTHILDMLRVPVSLYAAVGVFALTSLWLGLSIIARQQVTQLNAIVAWIAIALLLWRLIDIFAEATQRKLISNGRFFGFSSILFFVRRIVKMIFGVVVLIIILANLGVDVTAGLAALGIGGLALALGAQKTLENFIGSLSIVIDQPVHVGDFCKVGDISGTIEDIGMRSTRIRTNDRTLVTIPNGDLSTQRIENYARRNRFLINKNFELRYDATSDQLRLFLERVQQLLFASEYVTEEGLPVRYLGPGPNGHVIELFCYINVSDNNEFLEIQQGLMLQMLDAAKELDLYFTIPAQTFLPALDQMEHKAGTT